MQPTRWHHRRPHTPLALSHLLPVLVLVRGWLLSTLITTYGAFYRIDAIEETVTWTTSDKARYVNFSVVAGVSHPKDTNQLKRK
jgi:hypothetical protein